MNVAIISGAAGLIGSESVEFFSINSIVLSVLIMT